MRGLCIWSTEDKIQLNNVKTIQCKPAKQWDNFINKLIYYNTFEIDYR